MTDEGRPTMHPAGESPAAVPSAGELPGASLTASHSIEADLAKLEAIADLAEAMRGLLPKPAGDVYAPTIALFLLVTNSDVVERVLRHFGDGFAAAIEAVDRA